MTISALSIAEWVPNSSLAYDSQSLPAIPDSRFSQVRFSSWLVLLRPSLSEVKLRCWSIHTPPSPGLPASLGPSLMD